MKVLLINPLMQPSERENEMLSKWAPLGLLYIASLLESNGHQVKIFERRIAGRKADNPVTGYIESADNLFLKEVFDFSPDIAGITATTPLIMDAFHTASLVKRCNKNIFVVIGGAHATAEPFLTLEQSSDIDAVVRGEGENPILKIAGGVGLDKIEGIVFRLGQKLVANGLSNVIEDLDRLSFPAWHLLDRDFYFSANGMLIRGYYGIGATIITARGCPCSCAFCQSAQIRQSNKGKYIRFHSPEYVIKEIKYLIDKYNIELLVFAEDIFSIDSGRISRICDMIIESGLHKRLKFAANLRVDMVDEKLLAKLKEANFVRLIYGCESGSDRTLRNMRKNTSVEKNTLSICLTKKFNISAEANIIIGLPGEEKDDILRTADFLKKAKPDMINRGKLYPIPGTHYYSKFIEDGIVKRPYNWNDLMDKYVNSDFTFARVAPEEFSALKDKMDREVVLPVNYMFRIKTNWKRRPAYAIQQLILMFLHCGILFMPIAFRNKARALAGKTNIKSKYVFR